MDSWFITGFSDAEGCFSIYLQKDPRQRLGWGVHISFSITLHKRDLALLEKIKLYFEKNTNQEIGDLNSGYINRSSEDSFSYKIRSTTQLVKVVEHFDKYPLVTKKRQDYLLFREALGLIARKEHLTEKGLNRIVYIKAAMNKGLSEELKQSFPSVQQALNSSLASEMEGQGKAPNLSWLAGFASGDGTFGIFLARSKASKFGYRVQLVFRLMQYIKDEELLKSLIPYLGCGKYYRSWENAGEYVCNSFTDVYNVIIPTFQKHPIMGEKAKDFLDWCKVAEIMKDGGHKTQEGIDKIRGIKEGINKARYK